MMWNCIIVTKIRTQIFYFFLQKEGSRLEKVTSAVREASVSRHNGEQLKALLKPPQCNSAVMVRVVSGGPLNWSP